MVSNLQKDIIERIEKIPTEIFEKRISNFRSLNFDNLSVNEIKSEMSKIFLFDKAILFQQQNRKIEQGKLYRIIFLGNDFEYENINNDSFFWEPPIEKCKMGRLNDEGEQVLYTSESISTALRENKINCKRGNKFILIIYNIKNSFEFTTVGLYPDYEDNLPHKNNNLMIKFEANIMSQKANEKNKNRIYKMTQAVSRIIGLFPCLPIAYPSVLGNGYNICFSKESAHDFLEVDGVWICEYRSNVNNFRIKGIYKIIDNVPKFFLCGTAEQQEYYPEIKKM